MTLAKWRLGFGYQWSIRCSPCDLHRRVWLSFGDQEFCISSYFSKFVAIYNATSFWNFLQQWYYRTLFNISNLLCICICNRCCGRTIFREIWVEYTFRGITSAATAPDVTVIVSKGVVRGLFQCLRWAHNRLWQSTVAWLVVLRLPGMENNNIFPHVTNQCLIGYATIPH